MTLDSPTFLQIVKLTPLVSIDLIVRNQRHEVLLGYRKNRPAQYHWFVPGGRIMKDEQISQAIPRISRTELGLAIDPALARFKAVYQHFYPDNFSDTAGISTHYVVLAHEYLMADTAGIQLDSQHRDFRWWPVSELLSSTEVHENTKAYFR